MLFLTRTRKRWIAATGVALIAFSHAAIAVSGCLSGAMLASEAGCEEHQRASLSELVCRTQGAALDAALRTHSGKIAF